MTSDQWITVGIPTSAVLLGMLRNELAISSLSLRMGGIERRIFGRLDSLEDLMLAKFQNVDQRFADLQKKAITK